MITHNGFKILADMTKFMYYLYDHFTAELTIHGLWPKTKIDEVVYLLEWYSHKLRPFMWEFYGIMTAASQAGLTPHQNKEHKNKFFYAEDLDKHSENI